MEFQVQAREGGCRLRGPYEVGSPACCVEGSSADSEHVLFLKTSTGTAYPDGDRKGAGEEAEANINPSADWRDLLGSPERRLSGHH
jgi:hypothetical protein